MATGSGKTLIMVALMLDCFKKGYRNFVFFVNSNPIIQKTKDNFCNQISSKYLFKQKIMIDNKIVKINEISNLQESDNSTINIYFTTIQSLHSLYKIPKENSLTFNDLKEFEFVYLADEAHHLNAGTKGVKNKKEKELKENWESVITQAFQSNKENKMFEFSATIPNDKNVQEKYEDKLIFEYNLKNFCKDGYSKRIFIEQYPNDNINLRFLGAMLLSLYRELVLHKYNREYIKPVILFKSNTISKSKENQAKFEEFVSNLKEDDIKNFYDTLNNNNLFTSEELFNKSHIFFKECFKDEYLLKLVERIQLKFKKEVIISVNEDKKDEPWQDVLNNLEDKDNYKDNFCC